MDLDALKEMAPANSSLHHYVDMLRTLSAWDEHMLTSFDDIPPHFARGTSRRMRKHLARLTYYKVVRAVNTRDIRVVTNFFTVDKKDLTLRLVVDGRKVNVLMKPPPNMELPEIHAVIDYLMENEYACTCDGKSYFYQVPISDEVGTMFCTNLAGTRGNFVPVAMTKMPMGWSYAPAIAQKISQTLLTTEDGRVLGMAWIDNFIFAGRTQAEVSANFEEFLSRCRRANVKLDTDSPPITTTLAVLGMEVDLEKKSYRLNEEWVAKRKFQPSSTMTPREVYEITGSCIWHDHVKKIPLCHQERNIEVIRRVASRMAVEPAWDTPIAMAPGEVDSLTEWVKALRANVPKHWIPREAPILDLWSDAADEQWASLLLEDDILIAADQGVFTGAPRDWHIFVKEAYAADKVLQATKGISRRIGIDNLPLVQCMRRGFSANRLVNAFIRTWDLDNIQPIWIPTTKQLADAFTRGVKLPNWVPNLDSYAAKPTAPRGLSTHAQTQTENNLITLWDLQDLLPSKERTTNHSV